MSYFFFFPYNTVKRPGGRCYVGIPGILDLSPDRFFSFSNMTTRKREPNGRAWVEKEAGVLFSEQKSIFIIRSVLSQSLTILCSVAGISHSRGGGILPYKRLMGMHRWMGSHFHLWIDYNGVAFSMESLEWRRTFSGFWGKKKFFTFTVSKRTRMFVL